uniref:Ig-like domain-containing protein n=1 Tax=Acanthochromis polyacanthus TaxID=80966 RepID=A0A3Q1ETV3_9TELE
PGMNSDKLNDKKTLSLSCRGSGFTFSSYAFHWIRQPAGKGLEWLGVIWSGASTTYSSSVQGRIEISRDNSNSMTYLRLSNLQPEDSAVYYCARETHDGFLLLLFNPKYKLRLLF